MGCGGSKGETGTTTTEGDKPGHPEQETEPNAELDKEGNHTSDTKKDDTNDKDTKEEWSEFELNALKRHNAYRKEHGVPPMELSRELCKMAQQWAEHLAEKKELEHSSGEYRKYKDGPAGENLYSSGSSAEMGPELAGSWGSDATESWYSEIKDYDYSQPGFAMNTGHFTQVLWKDTLELGIAHATYIDGEFNMVVVSANYYPAGNMMGDFENNVLQAH